VDNSSELSGTDEYINEFSSSHSESFERVKIYHRKLSRLLPEN